MLLIGDRLRSQGIAAEVAVDAPGATVHAGRVRLEPVLINLLQNAAAAMQGRPDAPIILRIHGDTPLQNAVCDNCPGLREARTPQPFPPSPTTHTASRRTTGSTYVSTPVITV